MISPIGTSYSYYSAGYASGATVGAARTAMADTMDPQGTAVTPVDDVPDVFSNEETERVPRTPEELQTDRRNAYEVMNSLNPRNAENLNAPLGFEAKGAAAEENTQKAGRKSSPEECETCKERTYVDGSNEGDVSFKTPGHISPEASASVVRAHEYEHAGNAMQEDAKQDAELLNVSVSLKTAICPECGTSYVAGGETRTTMRYQKENPYVKAKEAYEDFAAGRKGLDIAA